MSMSDPAEETPAGTQQRCLATAIFNVTFATLLTVIIFGLLAFDLSFESALE